MDETSLEIVDAGVMYPKQKFDPDDGFNSVPFVLLSGESPLFRGPSVDGVIIITSYRFYQSESPYVNIPLALIELVEAKELLHIWLYCKDGRSFRCVFESGEDALKWHKRIQSCIKMPDEIAQCFAFRFLTWSREEQKDGIVSHTHTNVKALISSRESPVNEITAEAERMGFDLQHVWRISKVNVDYKVCPSYPRYIIVPMMVTDEEMYKIANFRYSKRLPAVVWRHPQNGCVIARSSQPKMGILGWRGDEDENLIEAISVACQTDSDYNNCNTLNSLDDSIIKGDVIEAEMIFCGQNAGKKQVNKKLLIVDARSYTAAVTNRAKGGGYEYDTYYTNCEIQFMGLANIHAIRNSFNALRSICSMSEDQSWLSSLENTKWLQYISGLLRASLIVVNAIDVEERPVLVHCSDGWDRTPQIVALAEIMLDPYYRTKKGFQVLVEREWLEFGHKFADRCGHPDGTDDRNERSPVFLQWLDCIYQLLKQFQCHFEFNEQYLARLALHTYSCLFGTFLCNTDEERRRKHSIPLRTFSVWPVLNEKDQFHNYLYNHSTEILRPSCQIRCLKFWSDVYVPNPSANSAKSPVPPLLEEPPVPPSLMEPPNPEKSPTLVKTKSYDNLHSADHGESSLHRRKSDPNLVESSHPLLYPALPLDISDTAPPCQPEDTTPVTPTLENQESATQQPQDFDIVDRERTEGVATSASDPTTPIPKSNLILREPTIDGSTDTLVSSEGAIVQEPNHMVNGSGDDNHQPKTLCSVSTDTSDLCLTLESVLQSNFPEFKQMPGMCLNMVAAYGSKRTTDDSNSCSSISYTTPNHSRTPSSGFPATPCDDPSDMPNLKRDSAACQVMDFDGLDIIPDSVQDRIKKLIRHYKNKVGVLNYELDNTRYEVLQQIWLHNQRKENKFMDGDDAPSLADSASSGDPQPGSRGSEGSWEVCLATDQPQAGFGM